MALDDRQILNIIGQELSQAAGGNENDFIDANRQAALATYLGQPDGREVEGRSAVVSTDVADAIEWIMPEIVKAFTQNNDVVAFDPVSGGDEKQAELESQFVYDILMKENNGFLIVHQFIKDALMQKNGFIKCFYEKTERTEKESYTGLTEIEYNMAIAGDDVEILEESIEYVNDIPLFNINVKRTIKEGKEVVMSVPPEEFRVNKMHNQVDLSTARFTAHVPLVTAGELVAEGFSKEFVDSIPSSSINEDDREYRFYMQDETVYPGRDLNNDPSQRHIELAECYMRIDLDEDGEAELVKIRAAGGDEPDVILDIEPIDRIPFVSATAILMSHKLFGLSIYDRLVQIQEQKTTLWRNIFDNMYLQNNQRTAVVDNQVNIDDMLISRPGGIVRVKRTDSIMPLVTPPLSGDAYKMMGYLDQVRTARAGVSPESTVQDFNIGDRVGSEGVERLMTQKEELVGLMIRVIAETGIKPLCYMIRDDLVRHKDITQNYKFRGQWIQVNPKDWKNRTHTTVRVGTGSGNRKQQAQTLGYVIEKQFAMLQMPGQSLVTPNQMYSAFNDFVQASGFPAAMPYFLDPESPEGKKNKQAVDKNSQEKQQMEQKMQQVQLQATQQIASAESQKAQAQVANVKLKAESENMKNQLEAFKMKSSNELDHLKQQLEEAKAAANAAKEDEELQYKYWDARQKYEVERERIASTERMAAENNEGDNNGD